MNADGKRPARRSMSDIAVRRRLTLVVIVVLALTPVLGILASLLR